MSREQYFRATTLLKRDEVKLEGVSPLAYFFQVCDKSLYDVMYNGRKDVWSCTCAFGSIWSKQKKDCAHIMACKLFLKRREDDG